MKNYQLIILFWASVISIVCLQYSADELVAMYQSYIKLDTIGHFWGFFILSWAVHVFLKISLLKTSIVIIAYAVLSELGQHYLGYRNGEFSDTVADIVGVLFFAIVKKSYIFIKTDDLMAIVTAKAAANSTTAPTVTSSSDKNK